MQKEELTDLLVAWVVLGLAFANILGGFTQENILLALFTAGIGFLLHELAHKLVARNLGLGAVFKADYVMLGFALMASFANFIFAAPGAVVTSGSRDQKEQMAISAAGPTMNIMLALIFYFVPGTIGSYGTDINAWLALFNMIPAAGLDGQAVYRYNSILFALMAGFALLLVLFL